MILFVKTTDLFLVRHHTGRYLKWNNPDDVPHIRWSENLIKSVCDKFEKVVIFNDLVREDEKIVIWPRVSIRFFIKTKLPELSNIEIIYFKSNNAESSMHTWKKCILNHGGEWHEPINHKNSNYLYLDRLTIGDHILWIGANGDQDAGIIPEKYNSFMDLAKSRESKAVW